MDDFKKLTEQLMKIYSNAESVNDLGIENYFDENISLIGTGKHELFANLHEFLESFKFDVKRRGKIRLEVGNLHQEEGNGWFSICISQYQIWNRWNPQSEIIKNVIAEPFVQPV